MEQLTLDLEEKLDLRDFNNWDWLNGNTDNLKIFFAGTVKRLDELMKKEGKYYHKVKKLMIAETRSPEWRKKQKVELRKSGNDLEEV